MFSNLQNTTLPSHVIKQVQSTEDAVRNTHKLVLEQQEIQNTLSPANYRYSVMTSSFGREEEAVMTPSFEGGEGEEEGKKDVNWIRATRLKLERLVEQIKGQLSEDSEAPIYFDCAEEQQEEEGEGEDVLGCQMGKLIYLEWWILYCSFNADIHYLKIIIGYVKFQKWTLSQTTVEDWILRLI